jgi:hypothetical protein
MRVPLLAIAVAFKIRDATSNSVHQPVRECWYPSRDLTGEQLKKQGAEQRANRNAKG